MPLDLTHIVLVLETLFLLTKLLEKVWAVAHKWIAKRERRQF